MSHRYPLLILLSLLMLAACAVGIWSQFTPAFNAPFTATLTDAHTVTVEPLAGVELPPDLLPGDKLDLPAMDFNARFLVLPLINDDAMNPGVSRNYLLVVHRDNERLTVPVVSVDLGAVPEASSYVRWAKGSYLFNVLVFVVLALLILWRGRERAAAGLALWVIANGCGVALINVQSDGVTGMTLIMTSETLFLLARIGLYLMVDFLVGPSLPAHILRLWRGLFVAVLIAGAVPQIAGSVLFLMAGRADLLYRPWQAVWVVSYLIPVAMLFLSYRSTPATGRLRLRWMLWSGAVWVLGIGIYDLRPFGFLASNILGSLGNVLGTIGFLYAVLRHRAVDVSVAIDRTLVYGSMTALVVGILAALNSVLQHAAIGTSASLLLQIVVPLALGIVLGQVRNNAEKIVERVFFRKKYLAGKALRRFARHCGQFEQSSELLQSAVEEIRRHLNVPGVAIYERRDGQYSLSQRGRELAYPPRVKPDDAVFVAARGGQKDIDLSELQSALGTDGYAFPMTAPGGLQGLLVCANRPGEHFASDECKLLAYVARQLGTSLYALRMQESMRQVAAKVKLVDALASGALPASSEVQSRARELVTAC